MANSATPSGVRDLMQQNGLFPKKSLGQNFLVDQNILNRIVEASAISSDDYVVEIGPGLGALTRQLAQRARGVLAVEIDNSLAAVLNDLAAEHNNIRILFQDILKTDLEAELRKAFNLEETLTFKVCANIPYNITTPVIFQLLEDCPHLQAATLMMQKEVSQRLLAPPGNKEYGRLTLTVAYYADIESIINVSRNCFYPRPDVDSAVVRIAPHGSRRSEVQDEELFKNLIRAAFQKRRKTILNILSSFFVRDKTEIEIILDGMGISPRLRPENLDIVDYINLTNAFGKTNRP